MIRRIDFAPLDGISKAPFRRVWAAFFGGADRYFIPFFSPTPQHILTDRDRREIDPSVNGGLPVVPQVMTRRAGDLIWASQVLADMGYTEVDLNLGCPSGTVTAKGKGAGFLADPEDLDRFFDAVFPSVRLPVSVKTRLGIADPAEFHKLLAVYGRYPIREVIVHPRVQREKYRGAVHLDVFGEALRSSRLPIRYNGDLRTVEDVRALEGRFPRLERAMIGRGAVADPALLRKLRGGAAATRQELRDFTAALYREYQALYGQPGPASQRMKEVWYYLIHLFEGGDRLGGKLRRSRGPDAYVSIESEIFQTLPLRDHAEGDLA